MWLSIIALLHISQNRVIAVGLTIAYLFSLIFFHRQT